MSTLLLSKRDMAGLLDMGEVMGVVEQAFQDYAAGRAQMPAKVYIKLEKGDFRAMPGAVPGAVGLKWVNVHPANHNLGLPAIMGIIIYSDPDTAYPLAIMDATEITAYRTAATSANASKYLARPDSHTLGLIGAGRQAYMHLQSHALVFSFDEVRVYDLHSEAADAFVKRFPSFNINKSSAEEAAGCDIVCTLTPASEPVVKASWVKPGTHINAVGADAAGKQELGPEVLRKAQVFVDDLTQACHGGEVNVAISRGLFTVEQISGTLGGVIAGIQRGRESDEMITVFDSTGLSIEDIATARLVYQKAKEKGLYPFVDIV
ncbi:ornithine cyclodeaminase family protein [Chloroflexota bacterium]